MYSHARSVNRYVHVVDMWHLVMLSWFIHESAYTRTRLHLHERLAASDRIYDVIPRLVPLLLSEVLNFRDQFSQKLLNPHKTQCHKLLKKKENTFCVVANNFYFYISSSIFFENRDSIFCTSHRCYLSSWWKRRECITRKILLYVPGAKDVDRSLGYGRIDACNYWRIY